MKLYTFTVLLFIGIAGFFSNYYSNFAHEIFLGLLAPILVGYVTVFFMEKYSNMGMIYLNGVIIKGFAIKFIFYGAFILIIFTVYSFNPIPFMCSFTASFVGLHIMEALILKKIQGK
tara:strand:+ start:2485 stop:2835 length:351 start_codon:yes stop_codon:yes gene_type:complete